MRSTWSRPDDSVALSDCVLPLSFCFSSLWFSSLSFLHLFFNFLPPYHLDFFLLFISVLPPLSHTPVTLHRLLPSSCTVLFLFRAHYRLVTLHLVSCLFTYAPPPSSSPLLLLLWSPPTPLTGFRCRAVEWKWRVCSVSVLLLRSGNKQYLSCLSQWRFHEIRGPS